MRLLLRARELKKNPDLGTVLGLLTDELLAVSKCRDLVVNKGHYFGTALFKEEPGLSVDDKGLDCVSEDFLTRSPA